MVGSMVNDWRHVDSPSASSSDYMMQCQNTDTGWNQIAQQHISMGLCLMWETVHILGKDSVPSEGG